MGALFFLAGAMLMASEATSAAPRPIRMQVDRAGGKLAIAVVGAVSSPCEASYALEVTSGGSGNVNRSIQRGSARLQPGEPARLLSVRLGGAAAAGWSAKLSVSGCGPDYEESLKG